MTGHDTREEDRLGPQGDALYSALVAAHDGLSEIESHRLNARLVLLLANRLGDAQAVTALIREARALAE